MTPTTALRTCILAEVAFTVVLLAIGIFGEPFLPDRLRAYVEEQTEAPLTRRDWILLPLDLLILPLIVVAWLGLWRAWRGSRRLYTFLWAFSLPLLLFHPPDVASGVSRVVETAAGLVGGFILGLLYFSELRRRYEQPPKA